MRAHYIYNISVHIYIIYIFKKKKTVRHFFSYIIIIICFKIENKKQKTTTTLTVESLAKLKQYLFYKILDLIVKKSLFFFSSKFF